MQALSGLQVLGAGTSRLTTALYLKMPSLHYEEKQNAHRVGSRRQCLSTLDPYAAQRASRPIQARVYHQNLERISTFCKFHQFHLWAPTFP